MKLKVLAIVSLFFLFVVGIGKTAWTAEEQATGKKALMQLNLMARADLIYNPQKKEVDTGSFFVGGISTYGVGAEAQIFNRPGFSYTTMAVLWKKWSQYISPGLQYHVDSSGKENIGGKLISSLSTPFETNTFVSISYLPSISADDDFIETFVQVGKDVGDLNVAPNIFFQDVGVPNLAFGVKIQKKSAWYFFLPRVRFKGDKDGLDLGNEDNIFVELFFGGSFHSPF